MIQLLSFNRWPREWRERRAVQETNFLLIPCKIKGALIVGEKIGSVKLDERGELLRIYWAGLKLSLRLAGAIFLFDSKARL
jgi:hypothetical protein